MVVYLGSTYANHGDGMDVATFVPFVHVCNPFLIGNLLCNSRLSVQSDGAIHLFFISFER